MTLFPRHLPDHKNTAELSPPAVGYCIRILLLLAPIAIFLSGCTTPGVPRQTARYGEHPRNILDFWQAPASNPTPALICLHGGGFVLGSKWKFRHASLTRQCIDSGISVVAANYRYIRGDKGAPYPGPHMDAARVVQFVRSKATEWNVDPNRIVLTGGSAGGNMCLWIALRDDMADPDSDDPVKRQSTRVSAVIGYDTHTSNDPEWVLQHIGGTPEVHPVICLFYGVENREELKTAEMREIIHDASPINHATADDPPLYLTFTRYLAGTPLPPDAGLNDSSHHPMFGEMMCRRYEQLGLRCDFYHKAEPEPETGRIDFLREIFALSRQSE